MAIAEFLRTWASLIIFVLQAVVTAIVWAIRKSLATKGDMQELSSSVEDDMDKLAEQVRGVDVRLRSIEQWREDAPTAKELMELKLALEQARGSNESLAATLRGARETMQAELSGVHAALKRTERLVSIQTEHLMGLKR